MLVVQLHNSCTYSIKAVWTFEVVLSRHIIERDLTCYCYAGVIPVLPDCGTESVLFPRPEDLVPVGCDVCIVRGTSVVLSCLAQQGTNPTYFWSGPNNIISNEAILPGVRVPGQYNCTVTNLDSPQGVLSSSNIIGKDLHTLCVRIPPLITIQFTTLWLYLSLLAIY